MVKVKSVAVGAKYSGDEDSIHMAANQFSVKDSYQGELAAQKAENAINIVKVAAQAGATVTGWSAIDADVFTDSNGERNKIDTGNTTATYSTASDTYSLESITSLEDYSPTPDDGANFGRTDDKKTAQSFQVTSGGTADKVKMFFKKIGSPTDNITLRIETDNAGEPSGTLVDTGAEGTLAGSGLTTSAVEYEVDITTGPTLATSTTYWLVLYRSTAEDNTNYYTSERKSTDTYASGLNSMWNGAAWSDLTRDLPFEIIEESYTAAGVIQTVDLGDGSTAYTHLSVTTAGAAIASGGAITVQVSGDGSTWTDGALDDKIAITSTGNLYARLKLAGSGSNYGGKTYNLGVIWWD